MKDKSQVISEFNELVNTTAEELEEWLKSDDSRSAGWPKEDEDGESVGHESGRKIVEILRSNPTKEAEKYAEEQVQHMRKVVSYCKRHLAQEGKGNDEKSEEDVQKTKSYASLMNWGHDLLKARQEKGTTAEDEAEGQDSEDAGAPQKEEETEKDQPEEKQAGEKRDAPDEQSGETKKRKTDANGSAANGKSEVDHKSNGTNGKSEEHGDNKANDEDDGEEKATKGPKKGDTVSWNWGGGQPEGKVKDVKPEETSIETKNGNEVSRKGKPDDPAVILDTGKSEAIKLSHELNETED